MYRRSRWEGYAEVFEGASMYTPGEYGRYAPELVKPLIETPIEIRLEMHQHLPELLTEVGKALDPKIAREIAEQRERESAEALEALAQWDERRNAERAKAGKPRGNALGR